MPVGTFVIQPDGSLTGDAFDIPVGDTATITYDLLVSDTISPGDMLTNAAEATWTSTSGANTEERFGTPGGPTSDDPTELNNYAARDSETVDTEFTINLTKALIDTSQDNDASDQVLIGETLTWQLDLELTEGTTRNVVVTDQLAADMILTGTVTVTPTFRRGIHGHPRRGSEYQPGYSRSGRRDDPWHRWPGRRRGHAGRDPDLPDHRREPAGEPERHRPAEHGDRDRHGPDRGDRQRGRHGH